MGAELDSQPSEANGSKEEPPVPEEGRGDSGHDIINLDLSGGTNGSTLDRHGDEDKAQEDDKRHHDDEALADEKARGQPEAGGPAMERAKDESEASKWDRRDSMTDRSEQMAALLDSAIQVSAIEDYGVRIDSKRLSEYQEFLERPDTDELLEILRDGEGPLVVTPRNIAILIVGTRGDVQPFLAIGKRLQAFGHRVRLASHENYREFVTETGLEFFPLGGDPQVLAEYMVTNKGILPSRPSQVATQRAQLRAIVRSTWTACTKPDAASGGAAFVADAIIANPPAIGHTHVAEALHVPLHVFFTMPWTPTREYQHPLSMVGHMSAWESWENLLSYMVVENFVDIGVRDIVNDFRRNTLKLPPISYLHVSSYLNQVVPTAYIWSPSLAPKPKDWGPLIDVVGFCFLDLASSFTPPQALLDFLLAGPPPIYVGFGSLPLQDPEGLTATLVQALKETGQRGVIQRGWGGLGELAEPQEHIFTIGNCPHDWLFQRCAAVIHHGGAGTTAAGLRAACPTAVVPFFGDQFFWGRCCQRSGVGPEPIPAALLDLERLTAAIDFLLRPQVKEAAVAMAEKIAAEDGVEGAVKAFHKHLPPVIRRKSVRLVEAESPRGWCDALVSRLDFCNCMRESQGLAAVMGRAKAEEGEA